jgi:hypothetical protein
MSMQARLIRIATAISGVVMVVHSLGAPKKW